MKKEKKLKWQEMDLQVKNKERIAAEKTKKKQRKTKKRNKKQNK